MPGVHYLRPVLALALLACGPDVEAPPPAPELPPCAQAIDCQPIQCMNATCAEGSCSYSAALHTACTLPDGNKGACSGGQCVEGCAADWACKSLDPCQVGTCVDMVCQWSQVPAGTVPEQPTGDCRFWYCNPNWVETYDPNDAPDGGTCP